MSARADTYVHVAQRSLELFSWFLMVFTRKILHPITEIIICSSTVFMSPQDPTKSLKILFIRNRCEIDFLKCQKEDFIWSSTRMKKNPKWQQQQQQKQIKKLHQKKKKNQK